MKILYIIDKPYTLYGAERHVIDVILYQNKINDVHCLTLSEGILNEVLKKEGVKVSSIKWPQYIAKKDDIDRLVEIIRSIAPDIVHSHKPTSTFYGSIACRKLHIPHISTIHAIPFHTAKNKTGIRRVIAYLYHLRMQFFSERNSRVNIFVSEQSRRRFAFFKRKSVAVVNWLSPRLKREEKFIVKESFNNYLSICSIVPYKGVLEMVRLFALIYKSNPNAKLTIVGDSFDEPYKELVRDEVVKLGLNDSVIFDGYQDKLEKYYQQSEVFIFLSKSETFGLVLAEAMYYGLPVICSDIEVFREVVEPSNCFVDCNNPQFNNAVVNFLEQDNLKKVSLLNQKWAIERYDYEKQQEKITELYTKVLSNTL